MANQIPTIDEMQPLLDRVNELLGGAYRLAYVAYAALRPRIKNARRMSELMLARLVENIALDGQLASLPLAWKDGETYEILSGHHRVQAAMKAGLTHGLILYTDRELADEERTAIQLSHNALSGSDDVQTLLQMVASIGQPKVLKYAAVDLLDLPKLNLEDLKGLTEARLILHPIVFYLTDPEVQTFDEFVEQYNEQPYPNDGKGYWVDASLYQQFMDSLADMAKRYNLKSGNAALSQAILLIQEDGSHSYGTSQ